jgi:hypothetical protein
LLKDYLSHLKAVGKELTAIEKVLEKQKEKLKGEKEEKKQKITTYLVVYISPIQ